MKREIRRELERRSEQGYREFTAGLLPGVENILGVRLPVLRAMARELCRGDWRAALGSLTPEDCFEEKMLSGMVIGMAKMPLSERMERTEEFLLLVDNWSVCDSFCAGWKAAKREPGPVFAWLKPMLGVAEPYTVRFAVVMLLDHFVEAPYIDEVLRLLCAVRQEHYYVRMAVAWALSVCYVKFPEKTAPCLLDGSVSLWVRRKAVQKILESRRIDEVQRKEMRGFRTVLKEEEK